MRAKEQRFRPWTLILHIVVIVAAGFAIHRLCVIPFRDNLAMRDIEQRMSIAQSVAQSDPPRAAPLARANLADLDGIARSHQLNPAWYVLYGANCELLGRWQDAANAYTAALAIDQRPEIYFYRGLVLLHLGRIDGAAGDMITAVRFNPFPLDQIGGELRARVAAAAELQ